MGLSNQSLALVRVGPRDNHEITQCKVALVNIATDTLRKKTRLRDRTDRAWFSRLLHLARKHSRSILSTPEPAQGQNFIEGM